MGDGALYRPSRHRLDDTLLGTDRPAAIMKYLRELAEAIELVRHRFAAASRVPVTDLRALGVLAHFFDAPLTMGQLAAELRLTSGAVTGVVDRLERAGHVERVRDPDDRRRTRLRLTEEADDLAGAFFSDLAETLRATMEDFDDEELVVVERFLNAIIPAVGDHDPEGFRSLAAPGG